MSSQFKRFIIRKIITAETWNWLEKRKCIVCNLEIKEGQGKIVQCPHCKKFAHERHILEWLKVRGRCPHCKKTLRRNSLVKIK